MIQLFVFVTFVAIHCWDVSGAPASSNSDDGQPSLSNFIEKRNSGSDSENILQPVDEKLKILEGNPDFNELGDPLFEGDIAIPINETSGLTGRKASTNLFGLWTGGVVYYNFDRSVNQDTRDTIREALAHWEEHTCITFKESALHVWYLRFRTDRSGCWSYIGRQVTPLVGQDVSIGKGCEYKNIIAHEVGHAIGFFHEQARQDRDGSIKILWNNMDSGLRSQFEKALDSPRGVPYDLTSIMHYGPMSFSNKLFEENTIISRNPHEQRLVGVSDGLSFRDTKLANDLYGCSNNCPNKKNERDCKNGGYLSPYRDDDKDCHCICPPNTSGAFCDTVTGEYYPPQPCGGNVTEESTIETPNYPVRNRPGDSCSWWIQAPSGRKVQVEFEDFSFRPRMNKTEKYKNHCIGDRVEIRTKSMEDGTMYCGEDITPGTKMTSDSNQFIIIILADNSGKGRGLKANVKFV